MNACEMIRGRKLEKVTGAYGVIGILDRIREPSELANNPLPGVVAGFPFCLLCVDIAGVSRSRRNCELFIL